MVSNFNLALLFLSLLRYLVALLSGPLYEEVQPQLPCCLCNHRVDYFNVAWDMIYSDRAVMVKLGLTPRFAAITEPSATYRLG